MMSVQDALVNAIDADDVDTFRRLINPENYQITSTFVRTREVHSLMHLAVQCKSIEFMKLCLENGADVNEVVYEGCTLLHISAYQSLKVVRFLVENGADLNVIDDEGESVLEASLFLEHHEITAYLYDHGARYPEGKELPDPVWYIQDVREEVRDIALQVMGIHRMRVTRVCGGNDYNVLKLIGKHIWSNRISECFKEEDPE